MAVKNKMRCRKSAICGINTCAPKFDKTKGDAGRATAAEAVASQAGVKGRKGGGARLTGVQCVAGRTKVCQVWREHTRTHTHTALAKKYTTTQRRRGNVPRMNFSAVVVVVVGTAMCH